jgi:hypothetical protein
MREVSFFLFLLPLASTLVCASIDERKFSKVIEKDVVVIGGGASGTYAAVRLREDFKKSVALVETKDRLGGHTDTYTVPETNTTVEFGVQSYMKYGPALSFYERFGIETRPFASRRQTTIYVNIETGKALTGYIPPSSNATTEAFKIWLKFVEKHEAFMEPGFWDFPAPDEIPEELLTPFGEFAKAHNVAAALPRIAAISGFGAGGVKDALTFEVVQSFGAALTRNVLDSSLFVPVGSNSLLYQRAHALLKEDVYLESTIKDAERDDKGVHMVIETKDGEVLIKAKKALWSPYPSHGVNLKNFDEDEKEKEIFAPWITSWSYVGVIKVPCIPENHSIDYIAPNAVPSDWLSIRDNPYTLRLDSTGPTGLGLFRVLFSSNYAVTADEAKGVINRDIHRVLTGGALNKTESCEVEYKDFADHTGVMWPQGEEALKEGFVQKLYSLQGYRSTWWIGRSWCGYYSSSVWAFADTVLERMLKAWGE